MAHTCKTVVVTCIDFRFQPEIHRWVEEKYGEGGFDRVAYAGGVKSLETILEQIKLARKLHHIDTVVLVNHEDCGAYGEAGTREKHGEDLKAAKERVEREIPGVTVELYFLTLDKKFERVE
ncbi:MAG: hypothetical protein HYS86_01685 [Candidatus Chisholmbacteria bacterium]|nr:hypothetical protein [Candidatus Chisholmbacteria bacterium]